jgi:hypothetical protein
MFLTIISQFEYADNFYYCAAVILRKHEELVIGRRKETLEKRKHQIEQKEQDLRVRETRVFEVEPFLAVAKQLQNLGIGMEEALPWIETILEKAKAENVDIRTTVINVAQELRLYRQSEGRIEKANQELALINMATIQKQQVLTVLIDYLQQLKVISNNQSMVGIIRVVATVMAVTFQ